MTVQARHIFLYVSQARLIREIERTNMYSSTKVNKLVLFLSL